MKMTNKFVKDGKLAVIISVGHGAGWSTWAWPEDSDRALYDPKLVQLLLDRKEDQNKFKTDMQDESLENETRIFEFFEFKIQENKHNDLIKQYLKSEYNGIDNDFIDADIENMIVQWIPLGEKFVIQEYDGLELLITEDMMEVATDH